MPEKFLEEPSTEHEPMAPQNVPEKAEGKEHGDFAKENFEEHEKWQRNLKEVVNAMKLKAGAIDEVVDAMKRQRDGSDVIADGIRILTIVLGGGMQGAYGAGQMCALEAMGFTSVHVNEKDAFLGISAGAPTCAFGMAGKKQALLGTSYFYTICAGSEFINYLRLHEITDVSVVEKALRDPETGLDIGAVRANRAQFYVQAYNASQGLPEFINAKDPGIDMVSAIHASMSIPVVYGKAIVINGSSYTDGAFDDPLPIVRAIKQFNPTHVLILPNISFNRLPEGEPSKIEKFLVGTIPHIGTLGFLRKVLQHRQFLRKSLDAIAQDYGVKIGVAWPPEMGLEMLGQDTEKIKKAIKASAQSIFTLFGESEHALKLYEEVYGNQ